VVVPKVPKRESKKKKKAKMSVGESFAFLAGSRWVPVFCFAGSLVWTRSRLCRRPTRFPAACGPAI
jgi:hypothetical protein